METFLWILGIGAFLVTCIFVLAIVGILFGKNQNTTATEKDDQDFDVIVETDVAPRDNFYASVNRVFYIEYADSQGELTERKIKADWIEITKSGELVLRSFCYLRNEKRSFRVDKIVKLLDGRKRPVLENPRDYFKMFKDNAA